MSPQTNVNPDATTETKTEQLTEMQTVMADTTIVSDKVFVKLMGAVDTHQLKVGGKWSDLIDHCKTTLLAHCSKEFKDLTADEKTELKKGKEVILKSLGEMGKTESSAYTIRSYIIKMSKPENAETLAKLKAGDITVRASREAGRTRQNNPSLSNEEKYRRAINDVIRFAAALNYASSKVGDDTQAAMAEYYVKAEKPEPELINNKKS